MKLALTEPEWNDLVYGISQYEELNWVNDTGRNRLSYRRAAKIVDATEENENGEVLLTVSSWKDYEALRTVVNDFLAEALLGSPMNGRYTPMSSHLAETRYRRILTGLNEIALAVAVEETAETR